MGGLRGVLVVLLVAPPPEVLRPQVVEVVDLTRLARLPREAVWVSIEPAWRPHRDLQAEDVVHQAARVVRRVVRTKETRLEELYQAVGNHKHRQRWQQVVGTKTIIINSNNINRPIAVAVNIRRTRTTPAAEVVVIMEEI